MKKKGNGAKQLTSTTMFTQSETTNTICHNNQTHEPPQTRNHLLQCEKQHNIVYQNHKTLTYSDKGRSGIKILYGGAGRIYLTYINLVFQL